MYVPPQNKPLPPMLGAIWRLARLFGSYRRRLKNGKSTLEMSRKSGSPSPKHGSETVVRRDDFGGRGGLV